MSSDFVLSHFTVGNEDAEASGFVLHGALGSGQNFRRFARQLNERLPNLALVVVDLRGHGASHGAPEPHTVENCAVDLAVLARHLGRSPAVVMGHSFGGKVALDYARLCETGRLEGLVHSRARSSSFPDAPNSGLRQVWALDSDPGAQQVDASHEVLRVMQAVRDVPLPISDRQHVVSNLLQRGFSSGIANWMTTNVEREDQSYRWTLDLDVIEALMKDYFERDLWNYLAQPRDALDIHLVVAERSDRWDPSKRARAEALPAHSRCHTHVLADSGHWVHVDNPDGLLALMVPRIASALV